MEAPNRRLLDDNDDADDHSMQNKVTVKDQFDKIDTNHDGLIDRSEFLSYVQVLLLGIMMNHR